MNKIKILHYCNTLDYAGTARSMERLLMELAQNHASEFDIYVIYNRSGENNRLQNYYFLPSCHLMPFTMSNRILPYYTPAETDFYEVMDELYGKIGQFDIFHVHRSGYTEFPIIPQTAKYWKKVVETNIFGGDDEIMKPDVSICISNEVQSRKKVGVCTVIPNPVSFKYTYPYGHAETGLREQLGILKDTVVFGRIGRADNFDPIALNAFNSICDDYDVLYLIVNPCMWTKLFVKNQKIDKVRFLQPIILDNVLAAFYRTIDVLAHYRSDGESCGVNIEEAMYFAKPVISHYPSTPFGFSAQQELIGETMMALDWVGYAQKMEHFIQHPKSRLAWGRYNQKQSDRFSSKIVANNIINIYKSLL